MFFVISILIMIPIYYFKVFENFRTNKQAKYPWEKDDWPIILKNLIVTLLLNHFVYVPILAYVVTLKGV